MKKFQETEGYEHRLYLKRKQAIEDRKEFLENIQKNKVRMKRERGGKLEGVEKIEGELLRAVEVMEENRKE